MFFLESKSILEIQREILDEEKNFRRKRFRLLAECVVLFFLLSLSLLLGERLAFTIVLLVFALVLLVYLLLRRDNTFAHGENTPAPWIGPGYLADLMDECGKNEGVEGLP